MTSLADAVRLADGTYPLKTACSGTWVISGGAWATETGRCFSCGAVGGRNPLHRLVDLPEDRWTDALLAALGKEGFTRVKMELRSDGKALVEVYKANATFGGYGFGRGNSWPLALRDACAQVPWGVEEKL